MVAFEFIDGLGYNITKNLNIQPPFEYGGSNDNYYTLIEIGSQIDVDELIF